MNQVANGSVHTNRQHQHRQHQHQLGNGIARETIEEIENDSRCEREERKKKKIRETYNN